jgi:integrase
MARVIGKLTALAVRQAKQPGLYGDGGGLFLQVSQGEAKSWIFRFKVAGRLRVMGLGPAHTVGLAEAREAARLCRQMRLAGVDPIDKRRAERVQGKLAAARGLSFAECAAAYIRAHEAGWRSPRQAPQWRASLAAYVDPVFGTSPIQDVDTALVMRVLEPIWTGKPETARRVRGRIESVLDWAAARGYRQGENPARWRGHLENLLPQRHAVRRVEHHAALPYAELPRFVAELRREEGVDAAALEFAILTAARTSEVIGARWDEIDMAERLWVVPAARIKAGREHRVPLSDAAMAIVSTMAGIGHGEYLFPGSRAAGRPLGHMAMLRVLHRMGRHDLTTHGFRSCFRDWVAERTNFPAEAAELALAHAVGDKVEAAYRRGDMFEQRRQMMVAWANFAAIFEPANIVELPPPNSGWSKPVAPRQGPLVMAIGTALSAAGLRTSGYEILLRLPCEMLAGSLPDDPRKWIEQQLEQQAFELLNTSPSSWFREPYPFDREHQWTEQEKITAKEEVVRVLERAVQLVAAARLGPTDISGNPRRARQAKTESKMDSNPRSLSEGSPRGIGMSMSSSGFARDSPLEGRRFEPSVPRLR